MRSSTSQNRTCSSTTKRRSKAGWSTRFILIDCKGCLVQGILWRFHIRVIQEQILSMAWENSRKYKIVRCKWYVNVLRLLNKPMENYDWRSNVGAPNKINKIVMAFFVVKKAEINITMQQCHDQCLRITTYCISYHNITCVYIYIHTS